MKFFYLGATFIALCLVSCKKGSTSTPDTDPQKAGSIYKTFINSLDHLSEERRLAAIKAFGEAHPSISLNKNTDSVAHKSTIVQDDAADAAYWAQLTTYYEFTPGLNPSALEADRGYFYDCYTASWLGFYQCYTLPTRIMVWSMAKNYYNLWELKSHDQFAGNPFADYPNNHFYGVKHKFSGLTGITTFVSWHETLSDVDISNQGYAAYTDVQGNLSFSFKAFTTVAYIDAVNYWTYDEVF
jgi:hypothetical protein